MVKIIEELAYYVKIDPVEFDLLRNNESFEMTVAGVKIILSR